MRREGAVWVLQSEIFLALAHGGSQHLRRAFHKLRIDAADQNDRPFDQAGDFLEQVRVGTHFQACADGGQFQVDTDLRLAFDVFEVTEQRFSIYMLAIVGVKFPLVLQKHAVIAQARAVGIRVVDAFQVLDIHGDRQERGP